MRAITIQHPWAWAVAQGAKDVENRSRTLGPYTGPVAIHAGARWSERGAEDTLVVNLRRSHPARPIYAESLWCYPGGYRQRLLPADPLYVTGAVIAVADLTGTHAASAGCCQSLWGDLAYNGQPVGAHLILANVRALDVPVPARGRLGLWTLPADIDRVVQEQT